MEHIENMVNSIIDCYHDNPDSLHHLWIFHAVIALDVSSVVCFFFFIYAVRTSIQVSSNPGIGELDEPDRWFSAVYDAWLYVNDRKGWALWVSMWSYFFAAFVGTSIGAGVFVLWKSSFESAMLSWASGMFLMFSVACLICNTNCWSETKPNEANREEIEPYLD